MRLEKEFYSLEEIADDCGYEVDALLVYGITGKLEICLLANETAILKKIGLELNPELIGELGPYPIPKKSILKIRNAASFFPSIDRLVGFRELVPSRKPISETHKAIIKEVIREEMAIPPLSKEEICKSLVVTHEKYLRFKAICGLVRSNDIGKNERSTWLKIIYLLMRKLANYQSSLVKKSDVKMSKFEEVLKEAAKDHGLTDKGLSDSNLSNIYNEAVRVLMPDPPPFIKKITK